MRSSGHALAHWSHTMHVCAPDPGSVCNRSTARKRGDVGRRSAGYWNVKAGCGVYLRVTQSPLRRSTRKTVLKNLTIVCILRPLPNHRRLDVARLDKPFLAQDGA